MRRRIGESRKRTPIGCDSLADSGECPDVDIEAPVAIGKVK